MIDTKYLLTDDQIVQFITHGFVQLQTDFSDAFHQKALRKMHDIYTNEGNPGNNLSPRIPEVQQFFDHPVVKGALISVLGPNYIMHAHRHGHMRPPEAKRENSHSAAAMKKHGWHKDNYWGNEKTRSHLPWSAMIFYYPQDVSEDMGPTQIIAGSQNRYRMDEEDLNSAISFTGKAGSFVLLNYDMWHRPTVNFSEKTRYMLKYLFFRIDEPTRPTWNNQRLEWQPPKEMIDIKPNPLLWEHVWNWMSGVRSDWEKVDQAKRDPDMLAESLWSGDENDALNGAYLLAAIGPVAIPKLIEGLMDTAKDVVHPMSYSITRLASYGLSAMGASAVPVLIEALDMQFDNRDVQGQIAFALGEIGEQAVPAVPKLLALLEDDSAFIRQHVVEALGIIKQPVEEVVPALMNTLKDKDMYVRFLAGLALARIGPAAKLAVPALTHSLYEENYLSSSLMTVPKADQGARYVPFVASIALQRIGTSEALDVLFSYLNSARWCSSTTKASTY